jgi:hypothetical protein
MMTHMFGIFLLPLILVVGGIRALVWLGRSERHSLRRPSLPERLDLPGSRSPDQVEVTIYRLELPRSGGHGVKQSCMKYERGIATWQIRGRSTRGSSRSRLLSC